MGQLSFDALDERVVDTLLHVQPLDGHTDLAAVHEGRAKNAGGDRINVGIVKHQGRVIAAQLQGKALEIVGGALGHLAPGRRGTGERDLGGRWMLR